MGFRDNTKKIFTLLFQVHTALYPLCYFGELSVKIRKVNEMTVMGHQIIN